MAASLAESKGIKDGDGGDGSGSLPKSPGPSPLHQARRHKRSWKGDESEEKSSATSIRHPR